MHHLSTMDSDPFNLIKDVNSTLSKIEKKIDKDSATFKTRSIRRN